MRVIIEPTDPIVIHVERGKKYYSFKCPHCNKALRRQYLAEVFFCEVKDLYFKVKPKRKKWDK